MLTQAGTPVATPRGETQRTMVVSLAEAKLLERLRACTAPTLCMVYVGGDGEPKQLFAHTDVKREDLTR